MLEAAEPQSEGWSAIADEFIDGAALFRDRRRDLLEIGRDLDPNRSEHMFVFELAGIESVGWLTTAIR
jgi:hypothetical protein